MRKTTRKSSAMAMSAPRTGADSVSGSRRRRSRGAGRSTTKSGDARSTTLSSPRPSLQHVDGEEKDERGDQHQGGDHGGAGIIELLELDHDQKRNDFRIARDVAGDEDHRAVFADGARERQGEAGHQGGEDRRKYHSPEDVRARGAEHGGRFFELAVEV